MAELVGFEVQIVLPGVMTRTGDNGAQKGCDHIANVLIKFNGDWGDGEILDVKTALGTKLAWERNLHIGDNIMTVDPKRKYDYCFVYNRCDWKVAANVVHSICDDLKNY